jgi:high affinity Mn2+ porin
LAAALGWATAAIWGADARAEEGPGPDQTFALHAQSTFIDQAHDAFRSPYAGANSLSPKAEGRETFDFTVFIGVRPWKGAEIWANPEIDQGFGLSNTLGVAGYLSGEAYKVGKAQPYFRLQRLFLRQTISLGGGESKVDPDLNQLSGTQAANRLVITVGKFAVTDVFDTNTYAHDPKHDFLNWALIDTGTFDYAADAWGYTVGAAAEWYQQTWTVRAGVFDLSDVPNSTKLDPHFGQFQLEGEIEKRYQIGKRDGALKLTGFLTRGRMGSYQDAVALGEATGVAASTALVRRYRGRGGVSLDLQQKIFDDLGGFVRAGIAGGNVEPYEFADIDRTVAAGLSLSGNRWGFAKDTLAIAGIVNGISHAHKTYFQAGGLGILIGDGRLPHPGPEEIVETYYDHALGRYLHVALDLQFVNHPAYNRDRSPVSIIAVRLHFQY